MTKEKSVPKPPQEWDNFPVSEDDWETIVHRVNQIPGVENLIKKKADEALERGDEPIMITKETTLESLGADSLDRTEFRIECEEEFDIHMEDEQVAECVNLGEFARLVSWLVSQKEADPKDSE